MFYILVEIINYFQNTYVYYLYIFLFVLLLLAYILCKLLLNNNLIKILQVGNALFLKITI